MRPALLLAVLLGLAFVAGAPADDKKGTKTELGGLSSTTPASWVKQEPKKSVIQRVYQFALPKAEGDKVDAEIVIFEGLGGSTASNFDRWRGQYTPAKGKSIEDVSKESKVKIGSGDGDMLDVSGAYNAPPFDPTFKGKQENFRLLGIQAKIGDNSYHIKLVGPAKTVEKHKADYENWLKGFKK